MIELSICEGSFVRARRASDLCREWQWQLQAIDREAESFGLRIDQSFSWLCSGEPLNPTINEWRNSLGR